MPQDILFFLGYLEVMDFISPAGTCPSASNNKQRPAAKVDTNQLNQMRLLALEGSSANYIKAVCFY